MKQSQFTIGLLSITGLILLIAVIVTTLSPAPSYAFGQIDRGGDYIMVTGQFTENSEVVYITDGAAQRMIMYSYEATQNTLILWDGDDFAKRF